MAPAPLVDNRLGERVGMDRPRCIRRSARESTHRWSHFFHEPKLCAATLASIPDLYWLQSHCILAQRLRQLIASIHYERSIFLVHHRVCDYQYHSPGMLVSRIRQWQIRFCYLYKRYANSRVTLFVLGSRLQNAFPQQESLRLALFVLHLFLILSLFWH